MAFDFTDRNVIVTGGAKGIGRAVVQGIIEGKGQAIIADVDYSSALEAARIFGGRCRAYKMDLGLPEEIRRVIAQIIAEFGRIDAVVNSAAVISSCRFEALSQQEWEKVIQINLTGAYTVISALFPHMREKGGGSIVNISSVASKIGGGLLGTAAYASSKAGLNGLTKAIAKEGGQYGIRCNAVCPSYVKTEMTASLQADREREASVFKIIPLGRSAEASEIANMVLFFASGLSSFITGEIGDCDGGIAMDG